MAFVCGAYLRNKFIKLTQVMNNATYDLYINVENIECFRLCLEEYNDAPIKTDLFVNGDIQAIKIKETPEEILAIMKEYK